MKFLYSLLLSFALLCCFYVESAAQLKVGVNGGVGFPTGDLGSFSKVGYNVGISAEYLLLEKKLGLGISADLNNFNFRYLPSSGSTKLSAIALLLKYYFATESVRPFVGLTAGEYLVKITDYANTYPGSKLNPGLAPVGGFAFQLNEQVDFSLTAKYNVVFSSTYYGSSTFTFLTINAGIALTFGK